jgi:hypothetical protein
VVVSGRLKVAVMVDAVAFTPRMVSKWGFGNRTTRKFWILTPKAVHELRALLSELLETLDELPTYNSASIFGTVFWRCERQA